jgi:Secretion system C-terminal sorting domain
MKKIIVSLATMMMAICTQAQTINANAWCIQSAALMTDTNGKNYMAIYLYNSDTNLQTNNDEVLAIDAIVTSTDTVRPSSISWQSYVQQIAINATTLFTIDTTAPLQNIQGFILKRGTMACGIWWQDTVYVSQSCGYQSALSIKNSEQVSVQVYPNPATNAITIVLQSTINNTAVSIKNMHGQQVFCKPIQKNTQQTIQVNTSSFAKGMYYIFVNTKQYQKIMIQ